MNPIKALIAENTNPEGIRGPISKALKGADLFIGLSEPGVIQVTDIKKMAKNPIIFAMANPDPEIVPEEVGRLARIIATGRSDYPNQINNVLCFPGLFRGVLDSQAREVNDPMLFAAANAIADMITEEELSEDYIIPGVLNRRVPEQVSNSVREAAFHTGVARLERGYGAPFHWKWGK